MCYLTFSINFDSSEDADQFLVDFYKFKAWQYILNRIYN
jgi:hypothetical protein